MTKNRTPGVISRGSSLAANASLGGDGDQRISQLGQGDTKNVQLIVVEIFGDHIGNSRNGGGQFAGVHNFTPEPFYAYLQ